MITTNAVLKIKKFNELGLHYNLVARGIYEYRKRCLDPLQSDYLPYIVAGLISFDLNRMMGEGAEQKYDPNKGGFASRLGQKLKIVEKHVGHLMQESILGLNTENELVNIRNAYNELAEQGPQCLHPQKKSFHVGATKILHFLNPDLFIIVDSNAARAFKESHGVGFANATQPGYSAERYLCED